jgi:epoxide hydrolase-like predicted phosphatase
MIKAVLFDYGGVLSPGGRTSVSQEVLGKLLDVPTEKIQIGDLDAQLGRGEINREQFFDLVGRQYQGKAAEADYVALADIFQRNETVYQLAILLRQNQIKTGIVANVATINAQLLREHGFYNGFDPVVLSCESGVRKPDQSIYKLALNLIGEIAAHVVYIDDQPANIIPAKELGMRAILANSPGQVIADITKLVKADNGLELAV